MRASILVFALLGIAATGAAWAAEVDGFHPRGGAPGDRFYVQGSRFGTRPAVTLGRRPVELLGVRGDALLCRVPAGLAPGEATLRVNDDAAANTFRVLAPDRPFVHRLSAEAGPAGLPVFAFGRRLDAARVAFLDEHGREVGASALEGGRRAAVFGVPARLAAGTYTLRFTGADGLASEGPAAAFEVVARTAPVLASLGTVGTIPSRGAAPGRRILCVGEGLGPAGTCVVHWTAEDGARTSEPAIANGHDEVATRIPASLQPGRTYAVEVELAGGARTASVPWTCAPALPPGTLAVDPPAGPPGTCLSVSCAGFDARADAIRAELASSHGTVAAEILYGHPGGLGHGAAWHLRVPPDLPEGTWQLQLRVGTRVTRPVAWRATELPFAVTGLWPGCVETRCGLAYTIQGSGFGSCPEADDLWVLWTSGERTLHGSILHRSDRTLRVLPPPTTCEPRHDRGWTVYVIRSRGPVTMTARAGALAQHPGKHSGDR